MPVVVTGLAITAVKGTQLRTTEQIELGTDAARDNRRFFIVDARDRMLNGKQLAQLNSVLADCADGTLRLTFPHGRVVEDRIELGEPVAARFFSRPRKARIARGPWAEALSEHVGQPLRLVDGGATVAFNGHVGRCLVTSRDPESGEIDLPTLDILRGYRGEVQSTEPLPFGIYGEVLREGTVRLGDPVELIQ